MKQKLVSACNKKESKKINYGKSTSTVKFTAKAMIEARDEIIESMRMHCFDEMKKPIKGDVNFTVHGQLYSKENSRRKVKNKRTGKEMFIKSAGAISCKKFYIKQLKHFWKNKPPIKGNIVLIATIYYPHNRQDLDESLLMDCLQLPNKISDGAGIIENDRQIKEKHVYHAIDKRDPRCKFTIIKMED